MPFLLTAEYHEDASSWECGLAMIALASVIASPLFGPVRDAQGVRPRLFLAKEEYKSAVASTAATYRGRLHRQEPTFQA